MKTHRCVLFGQYILSVIILYSYQMSCSEVPAEWLNKNVLPPIVLAVKGELEVGGGKIPHKRLFVF